MPRGVYVRIGTRRGPLCIGCSSVNTWSKGIRWHCRTCGKTWLKVKKNLPNRISGQFRKGHSGYWKGKTFTTRHRQNISSGLKGNPRLSASIKGAYQKGTKIPYWLGKRRSIETRRKISDALSGRKLSKEHRLRISEGVRNAIEKIRIISATKVRRGKYDDVPEEIRE